MTEVVAGRGWPGTSLVGEQGSHAAWLLVQHATHDPEFMKSCLALIEQEYRKLIREMYQKSASPKPHGGS